MARSKAFDQVAVLEKAMEVFWQQGYEATSIQDLVTAMGINRGSLYDTFTDKRQLFLKAIAHYNQTVVNTVIERLKAPGAARQAIEDHFHGIVEQVANDTQCRGCLITNTIVELGRQDGAIALQTKANLQQIEDAFFCALLQAQDQGEIGPDKDARALARYFTTTLQGLRVTSKLNPDPTVLQDVVTLILSVLD
ncbi:MAG: TetR/AcrR family transcriptional regulator [Cyanothece sp. SIO2G6]|nr:TetR/AcrR family transcriptional regulator [Cyanothece sp. SIO2G6]